MSYKDEEKIDAWASLLQVGTSNQDQPIGSQADSLRISQRYQQCVAFTSPDKYIYTEHQQQAYYSLLADLDVRWGSDLKHQEEIFMKRNDKGPSVDDLFDVFFRKPMDPKPRDHKPSDSDHVPSLDYQLTQSEQAINDRRQENVYGPCDNSISKIQPGSIQLQQIPSQDSFTSTNNHLPSLLESGSSFASNNVSEMSYMPAIGTTSHHHIPSMTRFTSFIPSSDSCEHYRTKSILQNSDQQTINEPCVMVCTNCKSTSSPMWRKSHLHETSHSSRRQGSAKRAKLDYSDLACAHCGTRTSPGWRRAREDIVFNACGL